MTAFGVDGFNIDDRCAQILGSYRAIPRHIRRAVAKECERFVQRHIQAAESFAVETTLRTKAAIEQAQLARLRGFAAEMIFVAMDSIDENIARIIQRAQGGGHGASEREVRAIHEASLANLRAAIDAFDSEKLTPRFSSLGHSWATQPSTGLSWLSWLNGLPPDVIRMRTALPSRFRASPSSCKAGCTAFRRA